MIYFDNAATTSLSQAAIKAMTEAMADDFGNPSSIHAYGRQANKQLRECRKAIANCLGAAENHIILPQEVLKVTILLSRAMP